MPRTRNPGGRPPLPSGVVRSERVVTFLTREENDKLLKLAREQDKSISATCHDLIAEQLRTQQQEST